MSYEDTLIREATEESAQWCSQCERAADDCVCEELCDWFREVGVFNSGADVRVFPAAPESPVPRAQWEIDALKEIDAI